MELLVDRLTEDPSELEFTGSADWLASCAGDPGLAAGLAAPARFRLRAHRMGEDLYLEGVAEADFDLGCGRCLERYRQPVREPFRLVLEPAGSRVPADPEGAEALARDGLVLSEEFEAGWFRGSEVRLDRFLQEVIAAGLPQKPLCREECAGLCPSCGIDRNVESCECQEEQPHSPFAALAGLRDRLASKEGESE
ncbi:MAG: DUF177 domain-containing protein [bacterium]|nr:DUF177 domain-containing protein [bacterium]MCP5065181.1 DUF177 domain-containing protein [bacterium]